MNDMEISCFLSVARTGSFTVSARELSSTQQAVSRNIQSLENELGFSLLHRGSSAVTLTWAGERFMQLRMDFDNQLSVLERQSRRLSGKGADELYVAWSDWTGCPNGMDKELRGFSQKYPSVQLHTRQGSVSEISDMLADGSADIAILPEHSGHSLRGLIVSIPFDSQPLYVISRDLKQLPDPLSKLSEMRQLAASVGVESEASTRRWVSSFCADLGIAPKMLEILPNVRSTYSQLLCGSCFTISPASGPFPGLSLLPLPAPQLRLVFVTPQGHLSPWVSLFESYILQCRRPQ